MPGAAGDIAPQTLQPQSGASFLGSGLQADPSNLCQSLVPLCPPSLSTKQNRRSHQRYYRDVARVKRIASVHKHRRTELDFVRSEVERSRIPLVCPDRDGFSWGDAPNTPRVDADDRSRSSHGDDEADDGDGEDILMSGEGAASKLPAICDSETRNPLNSPLPALPGPSPSSSPMFQFGENVKQEPQGEGDGAGGAGGDVGRASSHVEPSHEAANAAEAASAEANVVRAQEGAVDAEYSGVTSTCG